MGFCTEICLAESIVKRNAKAFSLNAIVDVRRLRRHEMIFFKYLAIY